LDEDLLTNQLKKEKIQ